MCNIKSRDVIVKTRLIGKNIKTIKTMNTYKKKEWTEFST
jgi:hypothetical protein